MKSLLIVGAGGYGQIVKEIAEESGYAKVDFLDDANSASVGKLCDIDKLQKDYDYCTVAIGDSDIRETIVNKIQKPATIIHPRAVVSKSARIDDFCVVEANAVINANAHIGRSSFICAGSVVNHDAHVGHFCQIDCNAVVTSGSIVPDKTKVPSCSVWVSKSFNWNK